METSLYEINFKDGRIFRVFCANRKQKERFKKSYLNLIDIYGMKITQLSNGIHNIKQWEQIIKTL